MIAASPPAWNVFKQVFPEHWDGFTHAHPRYRTRYGYPLKAGQLSVGHVR